MGTRFADITQLKLGNIDSSWRHWMYRAGGQDSAADPLHGRFASA